MITTHNHTIRSHDGKCSVIEMVKGAIERNVTAIAFTDHADLLLYEYRNIYNCISLLKSDIMSAREQFGDKIKILFGVEMGEAIHCPAYEKEILNIGDFDIILASTHMLPNLACEYDMAYANIPMWSQEKIKTVLANYYETEFKTIQTTEFDSLAHITYPLRYINAIYKKNFDATLFTDYFAEIFKLIIKKDKALELNTSNAKQNFFMPDKQLLTLYKDLGGKLITLGADAHEVKNIDNGINNGILLLKTAVYSARVENLQLN